jgi:hypothetical protein
MEIEIEKAKQFRRKIKDLKDRQIQDIISSYKSHNVDQA